jgi:hypothetical protein
MQIDDIFDEIIRNNQRYTQHYGVVTAITNTGGTYYLTVQIAGSTTSITKVRYLRSYVPRVNDTVLIHVYKNDAIVIDALAEANKSLNPVAYRTTLYTVLQNVDTTIPFETVTNDDWDMWDSGSATVLTCKVPGRYILTASVVAEAISNVGVSLTILKGTQEVARLDEDVKVASHAHHMVLTSMPITLAINDTISMKFLHDNNPDMDLVITAGGVDHTGYFNALSALYLGP